MKIQFIAEGKTYEGDMNLVMDEIDGYGGMEKVAIYGAHGDPIDIVERKPDWEARRAELALELRKLNTETLTYNWHTYQYGNIVRCVEANLAITVKKQCVHFWAYSYCNPVDKWNLYEGECRAIGRALRQLKASGVLDIVK